MIMLLRTRMPDEQASTPCRSACMLRRQMMAAAREKKRSGGESDSVLRCHLVWERVGERLSPQGPRKLGAAGRPS